MPARRSSLDPEVTVLGVDINSKSIVLAVVPSRPDGFPDELMPAEFDATGLADLSDLLTTRLRLAAIKQVCISAATLGRNSKPTDVRAQTQLETVIMIAAHRSGAKVVEVGLGDLLEHLKLPRGAAKKRDRIRAALEHLGDDWLSPKPRRRSVAVAAAIAAAGLDAEGLA